MKIRNALYCVISVLTVAGLLMAFTASVSGKSTADEVSADLYYAACAKEFETEVRDYLSREDFSNAGINLTYVTDSENGRRTYIAQIHHKRFDNISLDERKNIISNIESMTFSEEECDFEIILNG